MVDYVEMILCWDVVCGVWMKVLYFLMVYFFGVILIEKVYLFECGIVCCKYWD